MLIPFVKEGDTLVARAPEMGLTAHLNAFGAVEYIWFGEGDVREVKFDLVRDVNGQWFVELPDENGRKDERRKTDGRAPYRCPVCNGNGMVPNGFYSSTTGQWGSTATSAEECRSCRGTGVVWG